MEYTDKCNSGPLDGAIIMQYSDSIPMTESDTVLEHVLTASQNIQKTWGWQADEAI